LLLTTPSLGSWDRSVGDRCGDELPRPWSDRRDRRVRVREALAQLDAAGGADFESVMAERAVREAELGRSLPGRKPRPGGRTGKNKHANVTDPDSRMLRSGKRFVHGYNVQTAVTGEHVVVAEVCNAANDTTQLKPRRRTWPTPATGAPTTPPSTPRAWLLIATTPATSGQITVGDPRLAIRSNVLHRLDAGQTTIRAAAAQIGVS